MQTLNLPPYPFRFRQANDKTEIFDEVRKRWTVLTPEEWVRQHFLMYLHTKLGYPKSLLAVEKAIQVNRMTKRFDIAVFESSGKPLILAECKASSIKLSQDVLDQAGRYNLNLNVPYLAITNGTEHFYFRIDKEKNSWERLACLPEYRKL